MKYLTSLLATLLIIAVLSWFEFRERVKETCTALRLRLITLSYKFKNYRARLQRWRVRLVFGAVLSATAALSAVHISGATGRTTDYGVVSERVVTNAGVAAIANAFINTFEPEIFNYHASGTGTTAEAVGDTALVTETGTRVAGTQSSPAGGQYRTVATVAYASTLAITEHGVFSQLATGGTLLDRSVFTAINVVNGDSIQFTYTITFSAGG